MWQYNQGPYWCGNGSWITYRAASNNYPSSLDIGWSFSGNMGYWNQGGEGYNRWVHWNQGPDPVCRSTTGESWWWIRVSEEGSGGAVGSDVAAGGEAARGMRDRRRGAGARSATV